MAVLRDHGGGHSDALRVESLPLGIAHIDSGLPGNGLTLGRPHEIAPEAEGDEAAALGFTLALVARHLARVEGEALLVIGKGHPTPYGHGLAGLGLDPGRLLILEVENDADAYRAVEEALRSQGLRAVAGLVDAGLPLKQSRRLHLAGEAASRLLLVLRPPQAENPNMAATRWRIGSGAAPAGPLRLHRAALLAGAARPLPQRTDRGLASGVGSCRASFRSGWSSGR